MAIDTGAGISRYATTMAMSSAEYTLTDDEVLDRVEALKRINEPNQRDRLRIRSIMNGGAEGILALLGPETNIPQDDMPVVHLLDSGLNRMAQKLGRVPDVKVDPRADRDSDAERKRAEKRERTVEYYDDMCRLAMQLPQQARWVPGYGFGVWIIRERLDHNSQPYPAAEIRDPYDCYPGYFGPNQQPAELAITRRVPPKELDRIYPGFMAMFEKRVKSRNYTVNAMYGSGAMTWEGNSQGTTVVEYYNREGTYIYAYDIRKILDFVPNPLSSGPRFVLAKRFSFDRLLGHYAHSIGLMGMMAKLNVLSVIAAEDSVFRETNIIGELEGTKYKRGRNAVNFLTPGSQIQKPTNDVPFQVFQQIDRIERQLRTGANYSVIDDAQSPNSFVTGQGLDRLQAGGDANIAEYQLAFGDALVQLDAKRMEWDEVMYGNIRKVLATNVRGDAREETYTPSADIAGNYRTRRVYGVMATWDDPAKIVTGLQLLQGRIIDRQTFQENLYGLDGTTRINERNTSDEAEAALMEMLAAEAQQNPAAKLALIEIAEKPGKKSDILKKYFTPQEPQMSPEEEAFLAQGGQPGPTGGPPPSFTSVLSQLESGGQVGGGVQTQGQLVPR